MEQAAALAAPEATGEPESPGYPRLFSANLNDRCGYGVSIHAGRDGYYDAETDDGSQWEWELETYVNIGFRMRKNEPTHRGTSNMVAAVARVLAGRTEDAAFTLNGDVLLLTRVDGAIRKYRRTWWDNYGVTDIVLE